MPEKLELQGKDSDFSRWMKFDEIKQSVK